jgi:hypothetical protein
MLPAQVAYWQNETVRWHNQATELQARNELKEAVRSHMANERLQWQNLQEQIRHNIALEDETRRANYERERLTREAQFEAARHNREQELLTNFQNISQRMSAQANQSNANTNRMNARTNQYSAVQNAAIGRINASVNQRNADTNFFNAQTNNIEAGSRVKKNLAQAQQSDVGGFTSIISSIGGLLPKTK